jgi:hypothetical protein
VPADAIWVDGDPDELGRPTFRLITGRDEVLLAVEQLGYATTAATGNKLDGGLSDEDFDEGKLPPQFYEPGLENLREELQNRDETIPDEVVLPPWSVARLMTLLARVNKHTAAGPSGLSYMLLINAPIEFLQSFVNLLEACQKANMVPAQARHSYVYPIAKTGAGGSTLEGARQICMIEVLLKVISMSMAAALADVWDERGSLHTYQSGFVRGRQASMLAATVVTAIDMVRQDGKVVYVACLDVSKAFQAVPIWAQRLMALRKGMSPRVATYWMEPERGRDGDLATCQIITDFGLTEVFENQAGCRMGGPSSPPKYNCFADVLPCWAEREGIRGHSVKVQASDGSTRTVDLSIVAFADDLLLMADTLEEMQKLLSLVDRYLSLFGVSLNPSKSVAMKIGGEWGSAEKLTLTQDKQGQRVQVPIHLAEQDEGVRYLGVWIQADGGWETMHAKVEARTAHWMQALRAAGRGVSAWQAAHFLKATVGGYLR